MIEGKTTKMLLLVEVEEKSTIILSGQNYAKMKWKVLKVVENLEDGKYFQESDDVSQLKEEMVWLQNQRNRLEEQNKRLSNKNQRIAEWKEAVELYYKNKTFELETSLKRSEEQVLNLKSKYADLKNEYASLKNKMETTVKLNNKLIAEQKKKSKHDSVNKFDYKVEQQQMAYKNLKKGISQIQNMAEKMESFILEEGVGYEDTGLENKENDLFDYEKLYHLRDQILKKDKQLIYHVLDIKSKLWDCVLSYKEAELKQTTQIGSKEIACTIDTLLSTGNSFFQLMQIAENKKININQIFAGLIKQKKIYDERVKKLMLEKIELLLKISKQEEVSPYKFGTKNFGN